MQVAQADQVEFFLAVEASELLCGAMIEQAGGGDQGAAVQIAHADVLAVRIIVIHVQAQFGCLQLRTEFTAEDAEPQRLSFTQGLGTLQPFGLQ